MAFSLVLLMVMFGGQPCLAGPSGLQGNAWLDRKANTARVLYPIAGTSGAPTFVSFVLEGSALKAVFPNGKTAWSVEIAGKDYCGGFDFDQDGWPDLGFVVYKPTARREGTHTIHTTQFFLVRGKTGEILDVTSPLEDKWWPDLGYPTEQWLRSALLFGAGTAVFSLAPYYATEGFFHRYAGGRFQKDRYVYPSTPAYDQAYRNDRTNAYAAGQCFVENSHLNNGLFIRVNGKDRLLFFTSSRVVQYAVAPFGPDQLVCDHPFLNGNRTELAGRNYGLVAVDPAAGHVVTIIAGTPAFSVYQDLKARKLFYDPWGSIERHVTRYDAAADRLDHRFFSYAHDNGDGHKYQNRIVYPNCVYIPGPPGRASRLAYNVYRDGQWHLHVSQPGSTADEIVLPKVFLWDIIARGARTLLVVSPTRPPRDPEADSGYFPLWQTDLVSWDESGRRVTPVNSFRNAIPHLLPAFREGGRSATQGVLYPVLRVGKDGGRLLLERRDGQLFLEGE